MPDTHPSTTSSPRLLTLMLNMGPFLVSIDATALLTAMPEISSQLGTSMTFASLALVIYTLMFAGLILPLGWVMDRTDGFLLLKVGYLLFAVASLVCMIAPDIFWLCAGRCLQGAGGAILYATPPVLIKRAVPQQLQDRMYADLVVISRLGMLLGLPVGGFVAEHLGWHWIFGANLPLSAIGVALMLRKTAPPPALDTERPPLDIQGTVLSFAACGLFIFILNQGKMMGWGSPVIIGAIILFAASSWFFIRRQTACRHPLIDLTLFKLRQYRAAMLTVSIVLLAGSGLSFMYPFFLTSIAGLSIDKTGLFLAIEPLFAVMLGSVATSAAIRFGCERLITGTMVIRIGTLLALAFMVKAPSLAILALIFVISGIVAGLQFGPLTASVMAAVPPEKAGSGGALFSQARLLAQMSGIVLFEALYTQMQTVVSNNGGIRFTAIFLLAAAMFTAALISARGLRDAR